VLPASLPASTGQTVGTLHIADEPALKRKHDALVDVFERLGKLSAPPQLLARNQRVPDHRGRGQPPTGGSRQPTVGVVKCVRRGHQIKNGLRYRRPRQLPGRQKLTGNNP
jgi:hypothetical protein